MIYVLFAWDEYYPAGGHRDVKGWWETPPSHDPEADGKAVARVLDSLIALTDADWVPQWWELVAFEEPLRVVQTWQHTNRFTSEEPVFARVANLHD